jgi:4-carboxymuconolactone decarboxylase
MSDDARTETTTKMLSGPQFERGAKTRRAVLGAAHVDKSVADADDFTAIIVKLATEQCWDGVWNRDGLDLRTRSLLNLAMLPAMGKFDELRLHVRGAINNGVSVAEIQEVLIHVTFYCGFPTGTAAFKAAHDVLLEEGLIPRSRSTETTSGGAGE